MSESIIRRNKRIENADPRIFGCSILQNGSSSWSSALRDPAENCTYIDDATDFTPVKVYANGLVTNYGSWEDIITNILGIRPCLVQNRQVVAYLNPDNFAQDENGDDVDTTSGYSGDVMIEFKRCWYKWSISGSPGSDSTITFEVTQRNMNGNPGWVSNAFLAEDGSGSSVDSFFCGAYNGYIDRNGCLRSLSGQDIAYRHSLEEFRNAATANGAGYQVMSIYKWMYILGIFVLLMKTRDSSEIGNGYTNTSGGYPIAKGSTGSLDTRGMFYGSSSTSASVKFCGIENLWGMASSNLIEGAMIGVTNTHNIYMKKCGPYNNNGSGYSNIGTLRDRVTDLLGRNQITAMQVYENSIILPYQVLAPSYTFSCWCGRWAYNYETGDGIRVIDSGGIGSETGNGIFSMSFKSGPNSAPSYGGARLICA